jgi:hypothetical protein
MNISQIKAFLGEQPQHLGNENSIQNQLRETGLKQAKSGQHDQASQKIDKFSFSTSLGVRLYSNSLNDNLVVDSQKPNFSVSGSVGNEATAFDFEKIAKNVLNFVGGAIKNAQNRGADVDELNSLFEQASSGVLKGIKLAEQDLAGFMNEEIANGISKSKSLVEEGISNLKRDMFNTEALEAQKPSKSIVNFISESVLNQESGELSITTRDGDTVNITFQDFEKIEFSQKQAQQLSKETPQVEGVEVSQPAKNDVPPVVNNIATSDIDLIEKSGLKSNQVQESKSSSTSTEENVVFYQESSFSFSVRGELAQEELKAIGQLVSDANELAEEFFNGDIETAFKQALVLGFDEQELSSFALQLTKIENTEVIKAYETVSRFDHDGVDSNPAKAVKPVTDYLNKLLNVLDGSSLQLEDNKSYENIINELINRLGEDVATPDLISAINRFNIFNQKLVDNLPIGYQPKK